MLPVLLLCAAAAAAVSGELSVTTYNHGKTATSGELIFEDNFDELDLATWQHELTLWGGGVSRPPPRHRHPSALVSLERMQCRLTPLRGGTAYHSRHVPTS